MKKPVQISLPIPCHENWENMVNSEVGKFCLSCEKHIVDFTKLSDTEVIEVYNKGNYECGGFLPSQLNRNFTTPKHKRTLWWAAALMSFFAIGNTTMYSQKKPLQEQNASNETNEEFIISGTVRDKNKKPLEGAKVIVEGKNIKVLTDHNGNFALAVTKGDILIIKYRGKMKEEILIQGYKSQEVYLLTRKEERELPRRIGRYF